MLVDYWFFELSLSQGYMNIALVYLGSTEYCSASIHSGVCSIHTKSLQCFPSGDSYLRIKDNFVQMNVNVKFSLRRSLETVGWLTYLDSLL